MSGTFGLRRLGRTADSLLTMNDQIEDVRVFLLDDHEVVRRGHQ
jgi:hypothetical protein